ncbi:MAG TPA: hypothetical protein VL242_42040, partial [Sorangium sp.]|nr:hypothetical protein [Sorangium sp.]
RMSSIRRPEECAAAAGPGARMSCPTSPTLARSSGPGDLGGARTQDQLGPDGGSAVAALIDAELAGRAGAAA